MYDFSTLRIQSDGTTELVFREPHVGGWTFENAKPPVYIPAEDIFARDIRWEGQSTAGHVWSVIQTFAPDALDKAFAAALSVLHKTPEAVNHRDKLAQMPSVQAGRTLQDVRWPEMTHKFCS